ncbi:hypothetical protein FRC11_011823 [Ceratobasidium sp. 423]|nr:hypothetical protein FRC11_011823 [Ceratobasidium sp. 423]
MLKLWDRHERPVAWNLIDSPPRGSAIPIQALVVWDTVGAIRSVHPKSKIEADILGMSDEELPPNVDHAFHVVAFHENRKLFRVTLFRPDSNQDDKLKEVWFPGAHSDVGGGDIKRGELQTVCSLPISHDDLEYPTEIERLSPSDAYHDSPKWKRLVDKCETRIKLLRKSSLVHETVLYLKNSMAYHLDPRLKLKRQLLAVNDLGSIGWDIRASLVARNAFESFKHANAMAKQKLEEQAAYYRSRVNSLSAPLTPRSSIPSIDLIPSTKERNPQSRRSSIAGNTLPNTPKLSSTLSTKGTRHRAGSHVPARSQSFVVGQATLQDPTRDARHPARRDMHLGGVLPFQEPVPGSWRSSLPDFAKSKPKDRDNKVLPSHMFGEMVHMQR